MLQAKFVMEWLRSVVMRDPEAYVGIDEGGICLVCFSEKDIYVEVVGIAEEEGEE